jgi:lactoylglutathione lyase
MKPKKSHYPVIFLLSVAAIWLARELIAVDWSGLAPVIATAQAQESSGGASSTSTRTPPIHYPDFPIEKGRTRLFHISLVVADLEESVDFYTNMLGFKVIRYQNMSPYNAAFIWTGDGEPIIELMQAMPDAEGAAPVGFGHLGLFVENVDDLYEKTITAGATWHSEPRRPGPGAPYMGFIKDPDGNRVEIMANPKGGCTSCHRGPHLN